MTTTYSYDVFKMSFTCPPDVLKFINFNRQAYHQINCYSTTVSEAEPGASGSANLYKYR